VDTSTSKVDTSAHGFTISTSPPNPNERSVMADRYAKTRSFRPWDGNRKRLDYAEEKLGLNISEVVNEVLEQHLKTHLERKAKQLREALSVPVP
jgi:hypothetical protein